MRYYDPEFAILRLIDGKPVKVSADDALMLPGRVYQFNDQLFLLLAAAFQNKDQQALEGLWGAAHQFIPPNEPGAMPIVARGVGPEGPLTPLPPELSE